MKCYENGKHDGSVVTRRVLTDDGTLLKRRYSFAKCDRHYKRDLRNAVKRGEAAAHILSMMKEVKR